MSQVVIDRPLPPPGAAPAERFDASAWPARAKPGFLRLARWLIHQTPAFLVMLALAGLGVYGHRTDWTLPKFSDLTGRAVAARDDWCPEHGVPESQCVECQPDLLPPGNDYAWCTDHGVHNCPLEHPEVAQLKQPPAVAESDRERASRALASGGRPENNPLCKNYRRRIQFASLESVQKAGVDVGVVDRQPVTEAISASGQITYDQTRVASLSARLPGTVFRVMKAVGDWVRGGEILALIDAAEVGRAKSEFLQALAQEELTRKTLDRLEQLSTQGIVAGRQALAAQADHMQARARLLSVQQALANVGLPVNVESLRGLPAAELDSRLRTLGIPPEVSQNLPTSEITANLLPLRAPLDGIVVERHAVAGEVLDNFRVVFQLADTGRMWLTLAISLEDAGQVVLGQPVRFRPDGSGDEVRGTVGWISTTADPQTRTVTVRADLPNPGGRLRNETFGAGTIVVREEPEAIVVPNEAIHWEGDCHVVFVRDKHYFDSPQSPKVFHVRTVRLGAGNGNFTEVIAGVLAGEVVAGRGSDVLRAELLKNSLGEGCCAVK